MRRIVFAPSFGRQIDDIGVYIEEQFGEGVRRGFIADIAATCSLIADFPGVGKTDHGYDTRLAGFVFRQNWIFFEYDDEEVRFLHVVDGRRDKSKISFD